MGSTSQLCAWLEAGHDGILARLVAAEGSTPREPGALMLVGADGTVLGSLSGGCVEGWVVERARALMAAGASGFALEVVGAGADPDLDAGLLCGGTMSILFHEVGPLVRRPLHAFARAGRDARSAVLATRIGTDGCAALAVLGDPGADHETVGSLGGDDLDALAAAAATRLIEDGHPLVDYVDAGPLLGPGERLILHMTRRSPTLVVAGADDFTDALTRTARSLGWAAVVVDPRAALATAARFPDAEVVVAWPDRHLAAIGGRLGPEDAVCVMTHDAKVDVAALIAAFGTAVGYVGAMGSRATHEDRLRRLRLAGVDDADLARLHSPIGLDIGAATPEETAVAVVAEIIAARTGRSGAALRSTSGPIRSVRGVPVCNAPPP